MSAPLGGSSNRTGGVQGGLGPPPTMASQETCLCYEKATSQNRPKTSGHRGQKKNTNPSDKPTHAAPPRLVLYIPHLQNAMRSDAPTATPALINKTEVDVILGGSGGGGGAPNVCRNVLAVGVAAESLARVRKHWERFSRRSEEDASSHPPLDRKRGTELGSGGRGHAAERRSAEGGVGWGAEARREARWEETLPAIVRRARGRTGTDP